MMISASWRWRAGVISHPHVARHYAIASSDRPRAARTGQGGAKLRMERVVLPDGTHAAVDDWQVIPVTQDMIATMNEHPHISMPVSRHFPLAGLIGAAINAGLMDDFLKGRGMTDPRECPVIGDYGGAANSPFLLACRLNRWPNPDPEHSVVHCTADLEQEIGTLSWPVHLLGLVHAPIDEKVCRPLGDGSSDAQAGTVPLCVIGKPAALASQIAVDLVQRVPQPV